jgi:hypothetical protein
MDLRIRVSKWTLSYSWGLGVLDDSIKIGKNCHVLSVVHSDSVSSIRSPSLPSGRPIFKEVFSFAGGALVCLEWEVSGGLQELCNWSVQTIICTTSCKRWKLQTASHSFSRSGPWAACDMLLKGDRICCHTGQEQR